MIPPAKSLVVLLCFVAAGLIACGDGASGPAPTIAPSVTASPSPRPTLAPGQPTPKPNADKDRAFTLASRGKVYQPTVAEFRALPQVSIETREGTRKGVLLSALIGNVTTEATDIVTIEGRPADLSQSGFVRRPLAELLSTTVFFLNDKGHVTIASTVLPTVEWLAYVGTVSVSR